MAAVHEISVFLPVLIKTMPRYFIHMAYNGSRYHGYQIQPHSNSVQETVEQCLSLKLGQTVSITGCGRTDTGVHARNYYAHFDIDKEISNADALAHQMNAFLPDDIVIYRIWQVTPDMHARFDAVSRTYRYYITRTKNPFHTQDAYFLYGDLDIAKMQEAANILFEYEDFTSFSKVHTQDLQSGQSRVPLAERSLFRQAPRFH